MRRGSRLFAATVFALQTARAGSAFAEDAPSDGAELAYDRSIAFYASGDKASALAAMRESYRLSHHPDLLYNVAKLEREVGYCEASREDFREYLSLVPSGAYHEAALASEHELAKTCSPRAASLPQQHVAYWTPLRITGWSAIAASAIAGATAIYFSASASGAENDVNRRVQTHVTNGDPYTLQDRERELDEQTARTAAVVSAVISGSLAAGGALLLLMPAQHEQAPPNVALGLQPGRAFVRYSYRF